MFGLGWSDLWTTISRELHTPRLQRWIGVARARHQRSTIGRLVDMSISLADADVSIRTSSCRASITNACSRRRLARRPGSGSTLSIGVIRDAADGPRRARCDGYTPRKDDVYRDVRLGQAEIDIVRPATIVLA